MPANTTVEIPSAPAPATPSFGSMPLPVFVAPPVMSPGSAPAAVKNSDTPISNGQVAAGETTMADTTYTSDPFCALHQDNADIRHSISDHAGLVRQAVHQQAGDIRREAAEIGSTIRREVAKESCDLAAKVEMGADRAVASTETNADRMISQLDKQYHAAEGRQFEIGRDLAGLKHDHVALNESIRSSAAMAALQSELATTKMALDIAKGQAALSDKITSDGNATRALMNELKMDQLNRELVERNAALVECRGEGRFWHGNFANAQYAALTSQLNAFQSQLQETRQGMVNFGTMAGVGQSSTSNTVR